MTLNDNAVATLLWVLVLIPIVQGLTTYAICRLFITGKSMFERKAQDEDSRRIHLQR